MAEPHVVTALVAKRAELSGEIAKLDERRAAIKAHIANLDVVLRLFCYAGAHYTTLAVWKVLLRFGHIRLQISAALSGWCRIHFLS